ncbi:hypothetical protein ACFQZQ_03115 [Lysobacter koreensis]|uniref:Uncharacterized protein n=1 Tax=Lysobacter koreensis TaxID=266122 RepID=A0ABW2YKU2_9GAMM
MTSTELYAPSHDVRRALRVMKGRPEFRSTYVQFDATTRRMRPASVVSDPIYDLFVARQNWRLSLANATRYGEIRQLVVSPEWLP